ncbi:TRAP transporter permease [Sneathiella chinensis]|uniref:C4-dicarboxylate ABC transporter n=1 Tax=Sneathiella chinensis TaxID=349750 RepID=A0ABQ5U2X6_9PROT|nr:TRAP transporter fused permease subunit [Sneathiella chinensis]GLQ05598.1 C4-dicarboxylate ABC transporter [Sneathiella chinensis]
MKEEIQTQEPADEGSSRRSLPTGWALIPYAAAIAVLLLSMNQLFNLGFFVGYTFLSNQYAYIVAGLLLPLIFLMWPATKKSSHNSVPWYDALLAIAMMASCFYFAANSEKIVDEGWEYLAPDYAVYMSYLFWLLILEATRRAGGTAIFAIVLVISFYPLFADVMPGPIAGAAATLADTAIFHTMSSESVLGIPFRAFTGLVIGFLVFGVALQYTGGGKFFINFAFACLGHVRGGPAKVAIFSSGLMGSMSGSVITNVLTTGVLSIPAMRRVGFSRSYAGGVETCASTGGVLMPPIMGATAFIMATFLEIPYIDIAIAAIIPSVLYFFGLFIQIDAYAAKNDLKGLPVEELPSLKQTLKEGWHFIAVFVILVWMLIFMKQEALAPFYATALLLVINQIFPYSRWGWRDVKQFIMATASLFAELAGILCGVGLIVGALAVTGMSGTIANDLIFLAGGNPLVLLVMGALTSFILGIGMTVTAAYIFLAISLAPAVISAGLDPLAVHLFILYWGMLSFITPPVALGAFAAATVAGAKPMETGLQAMKLGSIIYFIPFFFVLNPALIMQGDWADIGKVVVTAMIGVWLIASGLQGYLAWVGKLDIHPQGKWITRGLIVAAGLALATPGGGLIPFTNFELGALALALAVPTVIVVLFANKRNSAIRNA